MTMTLNGYIFILYFTLVIVAIAAAAATAAATFIFFYSMSSFNVCLLFLILDTYIMITIDFRYHACLFFAFGLFIICTDSI